MIHVTYSDPEGWFDDEEQRIPPSDDVFLPYDEIDDDGFADWPDLDSFEN